MKFKHSVLYESLVAVMPITLLIIVINFLLPQRMQTFDFINFIVGNVFLIGGMTLYSKGTKISDTWGGCFRDEWSQQIVGEWYTLSVWCL